MFNNTVFRVATICVMPSIHATVDRLYHAALSLRDVKGQSAVARLLEVSPQVVKNWEGRGLSLEGALLAQKTIGCDANWLLAGTLELRLNSWPPREDQKALVVSEAIANFPDPTTAGRGIRWPFKRVTQEEYAALSSKQKNHLEDTIYVMLGVDQEAPAKSGFPDRRVRQG